MSLHCFDMPGLQKTRLSIEFASISISDFIDTVSGAEIVVSGSIPGLVKSKTSLKGIFTASLPIFQH